jgi:hypothetical protein
MPTSSSQSWPRGFSPLFRGPYADQHLRVSDAEREAVSGRLAEHFAAGRLDQAEFDDRVGRAMSAKTRGDLRGLFADLSEPMGPPETGGSAMGGPAMGAMGAMPMHMRRRHRHPLLVIVLAVFVAIAVAHAVVVPALPWLWIGLLVAIVFLASRGGRHSHPSQDR